MNLQELFKTLHTNTPSKRQFVWVVAVECKTWFDYFGAIANAKCELEDKVRVRDGVYIGTTISLANQLQAFTLEDIESDWAKVCGGIDSFRAMTSCD